MARPAQTGIPRAARRLLAILHERERVDEGPAEEVEALLRADLVARLPGGGVALTGAGRAFLARAAAAEAGGDAFLAQHLDLAQAADPAAPAARLTVDQAESPLAWLARRRGRDGQPLIAPEQLQAGERLRAEFTRAQLTPRVTANWTAAVASGRRDSGVAGFADTVIAARQRVRQALEAVGPEFSGLLLDVCCFLKGLADVERERAWPPRSGKVVLQLALDRLARHYGFAAQAQGPAQSHIRTWLAAGEKFVVDGS